jgi:hypothetical protein
MSMVAKLWPVYSFESRRVNRGRTNHSNATCGVKLHIN